ncbi:TIR domain-containing protein [Leptolyngbya sp. FACHB-261]|uniref:TIR domain-containing protein n=1 Tax=Leptolyngbya sp. FACHB-261 TaxID=2692806 RepID=UPI0016871F37|nr:TIR domain-containing protein [Leptolyngbya sp. FACHB-261]MBD2100275.1 nucleotide-binding protein [Leptolyngbya sp. FACHB-261]
MLSRFKGEDGTRRLITAICKQNIVQDDESLAIVLSSVSELQQFEIGQDIITQGDIDSEIYLILTGKVCVLINGRLVACRGSGCHIGEMALIDPTARRSATNRAVEQTVVAKITEPAFTTLANSFPKLWRRLALELAERLRERSKYVTQPNPQPIIFIGSSAETLNIAREIQTGLSHDNLLTNVWTDGIFQASRSTIEDLTRIVEVSDFAVLVLGHDDAIVSRGLERAAPRDNVVFELGLFMGALGRARTIIVKARGVDIKIPSDLLGITILSYAPGDLNTLQARVAPICNEIRKVVAIHGSK